MERVKRINLTDLVTRICEGLEKKDSERNIMPYISRVIVDDYISDDNEDKLAISSHNDDRLICVVSKLLYGGVLVYSPIESFIINDCSDRGYEVYVGNGFDWIWIMRPNTLSEVVSYIVCKLYRDRTCNK